MAGDGQVTQGSVVIKPNVQKVRRIGSNILVGFAGSTADALTLLERLEEKLTKHPEQLTRACVELAKAWRTDRYLRKLEVDIILFDYDIFGLFFSISFSTFIYLLFISFYILIGCFTCC